MPETYFLLLPNANATINLAGLVYIGWGIAPDEWVKQGYVATIQFCNGTTLYIDAADALVLQAELNNYNYVLGREIRSRVKLDQQLRSVQSQSAGQSGQAVKQQAPQKVAARE
jgi:hypothetical protein